MIKMSAEASEVQLSSEAREAVEDAQVHRVCTECIHFQVCTIYKAVAPLIEENFEEDKPLDPKDTAKICKEFAPVMVSIK